MTVLALAIRSLTKKGRGNIIKVFSLGTGLAIGLILLLKVGFEQNFDNFYPDSDRIYQINTLYKEEGEEEEDFSFISGAVVPAIIMEIPEIETATCATYLAKSNASFRVSDGNHYTAKFIMADSCFFEVLPRPMIIGNAKEILSRPMCAIISQSVANKIGKDVIGMPI